MKYTRMQLPFKKDDWKFKVFFMFVIILPIIAIAAGGIVSKLFIIPYTSKNITNTNTYQSIEIFNTKSSYKIYYIQTGVFINKNNADLLSNALHSKNIPAVIVSDKDSYRVITGISEDGKFNNEKDRLNKEGYSFIINEYNIEKLNKGDMKIDLLNMYIENIVEILNIQIRQQHVLGNSKSEIENLKTCLNKLNESYRKIETSNIDPKLNESIMNFNSMFVNNVQEYINNKEKYNTNASLQNLADEVFKFKILYESFARFI